MPQWLYDGLRGEELEELGLGGRRLASSCFFVAKDEWIISAAATNSDQGFPISTQAEGWRLGGSYLF